MIKILLLLIFLYDGEVRIEKSYHTSMEACVEVGQMVTMKQMLDPKFDEGVFAACLPTRILEAKNEK